MTLVRIQSAMTVLDLLRRQFKYDSWANHEELRALSALPSPPEQATKLLTHIIAAQWLWLDRLQQAPQRTAVWPDTNLSDCDRQLQQLQAEWQHYLEGLSDDDLLKLCQYRNSKGEAWSNSVLDILNQLILHAAHHRGQISQEIRRSGAVPVPVDYIHAVRKNLMD